MFPNECMVWIQYAEKPRSLAAVVRPWWHGQLPQIHILIRGEPFYITVAGTHEVEQKVDGYWTPNNPWRLCYQCMSDGR